MVGFSLFRRSGSRYANPTSQGVSLRGLGASGARRALVLVDGLPLNDPFGGWVYWARVPRLGSSASRCCAAAPPTCTAAARSAASCRPSRRRPRRRADDRSRGVSAGGLGTLEAPSAPRATHGDRGARAFPPRASGPTATCRSRPRLARPRWMPPSRLGGARSTCGASGGWAAAGSSPAASAFGEDRDERHAAAGRTTRGVESARSVRTGVRRMERPGRRADGDSRSSTTSRSARSPPTARARTSPACSACRRRRSASRSSARSRSARSIGCSSAPRPAGSRASPRRRRSCVARRAASSTRAVKNARRPCMPRTSCSCTGGCCSPAPSRADGWWHVGGRETTTPLATGIAARDDASRIGSESALSPRLALLFRAARWPFVARLPATARSAGRRSTSCTAPSVSGDTLTLANPRLRAERLWGGEAGLLLTRRAASLRADGFPGGRPRRRRERDRPLDAVAGHAPATERGTHPLAGCRGRGRAAARRARASVNAGYVLTDARVTAFAADPSLVGPPRAAGAEAPARPAGALRVHLAGSACRRAGPATRTRTIATSSSLDSAVAGGRDRRAHAQPGGGARSSPPRTCSTPRSSSAAARWRCWRRRACFRAGLRVTR